MTTTPQLRVLFFDVFGTCVAQRAPVGDELWKAAQEALKSDVSSISGDIRVKTADMVRRQAIGSPLNPYIILTSLEVLRGVARAGRGRLLTDIDAIQILRATGME